MNRTRTSKLKIAALLAAFVMTLMCIVSAVAQGGTATSTTTDADAQVKAANQELLNADKFQSDRNSYIQRNGWRYSSTQGCLDLVLE
jgi:hypothetical protein